MWSTTPNTASDNKKKEDVDDCSCSSSLSGGGGGGEPQQQHQQQQQPQLNVFKNNSKKSISTFDSNYLGLSGTEREDLVKDQKHSHTDTAEAGDSGFISGPQLNSFIDEPEEKAEQSPKGESGAVGGSHSQKFTFSANVAPRPLPDEEAEKIVSDSGCIDAEDDFVEDEEEEEQKEEQLQDPKQIDPMILERNVDAGMSEWFCNLSLQPDAATQPTRPQQLQQHQSQLVGGGLNNLDAAGRRTAAKANTTAIGGRPQGPHAAGNSAIGTTTTAKTTATTTPPTNLTPSNAWEQFYQQNDDGDTPLHLACISGSADVVAALIRMAPHPCLFNIQNDEAQTPLHLAALTSQPKILRMLLIAGAEPTLRDRHGNTALHLACGKGEEQCVKALVIPISASEINEAHRQYGHRSNDKQVSYLSCARLPSDLEIRNYDGERCVHLAAGNGHIDILRILVLYGADINAREGKSGRSPLHIAIFNCNEDLANFLLDECQKLNLETETYAGLTAYQVACILDKSRMQNILEKRGAEPLTPPDSDYDSSDIETDLDDSKIYDRFGDPGYFVNYNGGNPMTVV